MAKGIVRAAAAITTVGGGILAAKKVRNRRSAGVAADQSTAANLSGTAEDPLKLTEAGATVAEEVETHGKAV